MEKFIKTQLKLNIQTMPYFKNAQSKSFKTILFSFLKDYHKGDINLFWEEDKE